MRAEYAEIDDRPDATEDIESTDCFLDNVKLISLPLLGGRLGGRLGTPLPDGLLGGSTGIGPSSRPSHFFIAGAGRISRDGGGGGGFLPCGVLPIPGPLLVVGGLFVLAGRLGRGGGGGRDFWEVL